MVPQPVDGVRVSVDTDVLKALSDVLVVVLGRGSYQDIARTEFDALIFGDLIQVLHENLVP